MSILLVLFMLIGSVPGVTLTAYAATSVSNEAELIAALASGGEIELAGDITLTANINVTADSVIDLNDHTIAGASYNLVPAAGILLTLKGPGSVESTGSLGASWSALKGRVSVTEGAVLSVYSMYLDKVGGVTVTGEGSRLVFTYSVSGSGSVKISEKASVEGQTMNPSTVEISGGATAKLKELYTDRYANKGTITITGEGTTVNAQDAKSGVAIGNSSNKSPIVIKDGAVINDAAYLNSGYSETLTVTDATVHGFTRGASISGTSLLNGTSEFDNISAISGIATIGGAASVTFLESVKTTFESLETLTFLGTPTIRNIGKFDFVNSKGDLYLTQDAGAVFALQDGLAGLDVNLGTSAQVMIHIGNDRSLLPGVARYEGEVLPYDFACYEGSVKRNTGDFTAYYGYEEKSAAVFESGENMLQMTTPACKIERSGSTIEYYTIHEAFADAKQGETIELLRNVTYGNSVVLPASSGVTEYALELAGYGLTSNTNQHYDNDHIPFVINSGMTLNITDSTEEQTGYIQTDDYEYPMMFNAGTVIIDGGIYCGLLCGAGYSGIDPGYGALNNGYKSIGSDGVYVIKDAYIYHDKDDATRESNGAPSYSLESLSYITLAEHARVDEDFERGDWVNDFYPFTHITNKVIVEFDRNEGRGFMDRQRVPIGEAEALNECTFTRDGYAFAGWNTEADGSGISYADKAMITLSDDTTLYAQWTKAVTVSFFNDVKGSEVLEKTPVTAGTKLSEITLPADPSKEGYYFAGWTDVKTDQDDYTWEQATPGNDQYILTDFDDTPVDSDIAFYPFFVRDTLNVIPDLGAADPDMDSSQAQSFYVDIDEKIQMTYMIAATRPGYDLSGWYTKGGVLWNGSDWENATSEDDWWPMTPEYTDGSGYTSTGTEKEPWNTYTVTLTAHWTPKTAAVTYDLGDHAAAGQTAPAGGTATLGGEVTLASAPNAETDYVFVGWRDKNGTLHSAGGTFTFEDWSMTENDEIVLTAYYVQMGDAIIEFDTNGGTAVEPVTGQIGDPVTIPDGVADGSAVTKDGYTFAGWFSDSALQTKVTSFPAMFTTSSAIYFADWTVNPYTVTYKLNGGKWSDGSSDDRSVSYDYGAAVTAPDDPAREHYTFNGWEPASPQKMPSYNLTVEAVWEPITYTVTFMTDPDDAGTVVKDRFGALVETPDDPARDGLIFVKWDNAPTYMPDTGLTVHALWEPAPKAEDETAAGKADGKLTNVTDEMQYSADGGQTWVDITGTEVEGLAPGEYLVRFKEPGEYKSDEATAVTIGSGEAPAPTPSPSSGGGGKSGYDVTVSPADHGSVEADKKTAAKDETVTLTVKPDNGYTLDTLKVTAKDGTEIEVTRKADGSYSYKQPDSKTTVEATFKLAFATPDVTGVADMLITEDHISYISGYPDGTVRPEGNITRAETATMFYNLLRDKSVTAEKTFPDIEEDAWYTKYVGVLAGKGIMAGYPDGEFKPDQMITRAEFAAVATLFAKEANGGKTFSDVPKGYWAEKNIATAAEYGWITGYSDGTFVPAGYITRGEAATIVNLMLGRVADRTYIDAHRSGLMQFSDLKDDTKWYFYNMHEAINAHDYTMDGAIESWK